MFTVTGTIDGVGYRVGIHPEGLEDSPDSIGVAMGSANALSHIALHEGDQVQASPTSQPVVVDSNDAGTVLALLYGTTKVSTVDGDTTAVADVLPQYGPDVVY